MEQQPQQQGAARRPACGEPDGKRALTRVADSGVHGVAAGEEELDEPRGDVPAGTRHAHILPAPGGGALRAPGGHRARALLLSAQRLSLSASSSARLIGSVPVSSSHI